VCQQISTCVLISMLRQSLPCANAEVALQAAVQMLVGTAALQMQFKRIESKIFINLRA